MQLGNTSTTYFKHWIAGAQNQFISSNTSIDNRLRYSAGFFYSTTRISEYGYRDIDSLFLVENQKGLLLATADKNQADALFSYSASSIASLATQVRINSRENQVSFRLNDALYLVSIINHRFVHKREINISKTLARNKYVMIVDIGFCNQDRNVFVSFTQNDSLHLHILDTAQLKSVYHWSIKGRNSIMLTSPKTPHVLVSDKNAKKVMLYGYEPGKLISTYPWKNKDWLGNDVATFFAGTGERFAIS